jgi:translation initiation factor 3 subunit C
MILEITNISANQYSISKTTVSKKFKNMIETYDSMAFHLAAENYKDHIVNATRALNQSDWKAAVECILSIQIFKQTPEFDNQEFRDTLNETFKKASLEIFLYKTAKQYKSFCMGSLQEMFGMDKKTLLK